ncbi:hypothetical protein VINE108274_09565 [Vibrio neptunius]|uniref:hypothetical protein n=1 Tax=Vibrio neptunius TaxID=170651 RepID=UPI0019D0C441|nr:hypothetical protein [Vibrio neptunius]MBN3574310.1 hypothetical protein [Vibrio neptunius]QXX08938.1 hypothetical protein KW548_17660 [Vibrio neptunius]
MEELIGILPTNGKKRAPAPKLLKQVEQNSQLPKSKQKFVMDVLDTVIQQAAH